MSFEERLRDELQRTAAALPAGSIEFNEVLEQGHRARRRGIVMMSVAAAAVVALAVGAAVVLLGDGGVSRNPIPPSDTPRQESPTPTPQQSPSPEETPEKTPSEEGVSFEGVGPRVREWLQAIQDSDEDRAWAMLTPEAQAEIGAERFDQMMLSELPEGMGAFADAEDFHYVVIASAGSEAVAVAVVSGDVEHEGTTAFGAQAFPVRISGEEVLIDEVFDDRYIQREALFASESAGPFAYAAGDELTVTFTRRQDIARVYISVDDDEVPLATTFERNSGAARAVVDRDLAKGSHIATVVVEHESGRLYPDAIPFRALAP